MSKEFKSILKCKIKNKSTGTETHIDYVISIEQDDEKIMICQKFSNGMYKQLVYYRKSYDLSYVAY